MTFAYEMSFESTVCCLVALGVVVLLTRALCTTEEQRLERCVENKELISPLVEESQVFLTLTKLATSNSTKKLLEHLETNAVAISAHCRRRPTDISKLAADTFVSSSRHLEILCKACLKVPEKIKERVEVLKSIAAEDGCLLRSYYADGFISLLDYGVHSGISIDPEELHTVYVAEWIETCTKWCIEVLEIFRTLNTPLLFPTQYLNSGEDGWTLLHYGCSGLYGSVHLIEWLLNQKEAKALINHQTSHFKFSPLHLAALCASNGSIVKILLQFGADKLLTDRYGRTAYDLAVECNDKVAVELLKDSDTQQCSSDITVKNFTFERVIDNTTIADITTDEEENWMESIGTSELFSDSAGVIRLSWSKFSKLAVSEQIEYMIQHGLSLNRPLIVSHVNLNQTRKNFSKRGFLLKFGTEKFVASGIPHSDKYGEGAGKTVELNKFISEWPSVDTSGDAMYIFSNADPDNLPSMWNEVVLPEFMTAFIDCADSFTFYCGPRHSGTPFHFHTSAWNACIYGYKAWFILPPGKGILSKKHVFQMLNGSSHSSFEKGNLNYQRVSSDSECARVLNVPGLFKFIQHPGDIVFVPPNWSHAVLNLSEVLGFASEFPAYMYPPHYST